MLPGAVGPALAPLLKESIHTWDISADLRLRTFAAAKAVFQLWVQASCKTAVLLIVYPFLLADYLEEVLVPAILM